ncbi:MAG: hypothetical protein JWP12_2622 [Bacteroidetes bacterium]|nr:hypothetical protein [Bacteroidota bacterium]
MGLFKNIKHWFANNSLKRELSVNPRKTTAHKFNFDQLKTVGILFDASNPEDFELVKRYVVYLREHTKKVKVMGFFSAKQIPELTYSKLEYDFFSHKEVNWFGKPTTHIIDNFIAEEFDLLIDLNIHDHFSLKYIAALSKAKFKAGKYKEEDESIYDMMIDADNTQTLKYFLRQVDIYITMLNKVEPSLN